MSNLSFYPHKLDHLSLVMGRHVDSGHVPGLVYLVSRAGEVHIETLGTLEAHGKVPTERDTLFRIASLTKPIAAVAAMILVEECVLRLDAPLDHWLPELADRKVLQKIDGPLNDTVPAHRSITLRDLLTLRMGLGHIMEPCDDWPIRQLLNECGLLLGPPQPQSLPSVDEWMRRVGSVPLMYQPGERWLYDLGMDILGVLIARATGKTLDHFLVHRVFAPLGMKDTGFHVPSQGLHRLAGCYVGGDGGAGGELLPYDLAAASQWAQVPHFPSASGGLVSTVEDYHRFCHMLLAHGKLPDGGRLISRAAVETMTTDQLTPSQRTAPDVFFGDSRSWGLGLGVCIHRDDLCATPGRFGWDGGLGTSAYTDPKEDLIGILMTQRLMNSPEPPALFSDFWTGTYQALSD